MQAKKKKNFFKLWFGSGIDIKLCLTARYKTETQKWCTAEKGENSLNTVSMV